MLTEQSYPQEHKSAESIPGLQAEPSSTSSELATIRRQWISATLDFDILTADETLRAYLKNRTSGIPMPLIPTHRDASVTFFG